MVHMYSYICVSVHTHVCIYIKEYYSVIKEIEIMSFAAIRMNLKITMLKEVSQNRHSIYYDITYIWNLKDDINELK